MHRPLAALTASLCLLGCDDAAPPRPSSRAKASVSSAAAGQADHADVDAKAAEHKAPVAAAKPDDPAAPVREWLVWNSTDSGYITRWVASGPSVTTVAQRNALVHTNGPELFTVQRHDETVTVRTCECLEPDAGPPGSCKTVGTVVRPGLDAIQLSDGKRHPLVIPETYETLGEVYGVSLEIVGGTDGRLVVRTADAGYYCGAHQMIDGGDILVDLSTPAERNWPKLALPRTLRETAARGAMFELYRDCGEGIESFDTFVNEVMAWSDVAIAVKDGAPQVTWGFTADVYYVCSPDYVTSGQTRSGLLDEAASIGLAGPLPAAVSATLASIGTARAVGWGELKLSPEARTTMLAKFAAVSQKRWPAAESKTVAVGATGRFRLAKKKLNEGRTHARAKDYVAALAALDAAVDTDPSMARAWAERGYVRLLDGQLDAAQRDCDKALTLGGSDPFVASVHYNLGLIASGRGDRVAAKKSFRASLDLRPNQEVQKAHDAL